MSLVNLITSAIGQIGNVINDLVTTDEERMKLTIELTKVQNELSSKVLDLESKLVEMQAKVITSESEGQSWLQRNWRPITMLTFLVLIVLDSLGLLVYRLSSESWTLLQIGIGGYIVGRSGEKIIKEWKNGSKD